ncbi:hypothetical protein C3747_29g1453c [Trypanosoma cruzi]|uniref:Uncharacterized protein n=3 Tax=Trypanosoma cruzi TaxID=5693 RepID=Q4CVG6_TRYCC|nr:hypothetical protein, conserved [Trypanosoma cruzi]XP_809531.1 hypothetical protein, conserved [Trypanosoma cruzi]EAN84270.1 hypothetical protein, conserved [Trypanosoma cruzi]EAN87680.1 hypothetical protein, conserved [Trypanosoma cruzi]PWU97191.1 hypothetical protein C3747_246g21 [Trypanosoma cruzi]PWV15350.1 hypothetical protein C3747_29g1453c [Trypanosoma cruzi]RNC46089.1 hypothetical protein TcCL_NonESM04094 [Trypanosoma cruzi]|eukprot:XP_806121.1 hypothetical protein [Trypanosoma cruzi strain CL Brener]
MLGLGVGNASTNKIGFIWGNLIFISCCVTSIIYVLVGLFACRRLIRSNWRWVLIVALYWLVGMLHAFLSLAIICLAVACVFWTFSDKAIATTEAIAYSGVMVVLTVFFALGRKSIVYAL